MEDIFKGTSKPVVISEVLKEVKRDLVYQLEFISIRSKMVRVKYLSLIDEGFTEQQALELCKGPLL